MWQYRAMSLPNSHRVYRTDFTGHQNLKSSQEPLPQLGDEHVLVKIKAVSLNQRDLMITNDNYPLPKISNVVPCSDIAGEVVAVGKDVYKRLPFSQSLDIGDKVVSVFSPGQGYGTDTGYKAFGGSLDGGLQEYIAMKFQ